MSKKYKVIAFLSFCFVVAFFLACSDDFISINEQITINDELEGVSALSVRTGLRDSVFTSTLGKVSDGNVGKSKDKQILPEKFNRPGLHYDAELYPNYLDTTAAYLREFQLSWDKVDGVAGYQIRAYREEITEKNWHKAEKVTLLSQKEEDGTIQAWARMTPTPVAYPSKCVNCGECKKACPTNAITYVNSKTVIDYDKCIDCGECFRACDYAAIGGVFSGTDYYFAIRSHDEDTAFSEKITNTDGRYRLRYTTMAALPDSLYAKDVANGKVVKLKKGCGGNCTDGSSAQSRGGDCTICHIIDYNTCPVDAVYEIDTLSVDTVVTDTGAMFIDPDKCINCGKCALTCYEIGGHGAVMTEIIKVD